MRNLDPKNPTDKESVPVPTNLVSALIGELADEVPDDQNLEAVRADLLSASRSYENDKKKDLALRFYIAMRSSLRAYQELQERLRKAEKKIRVHDEPTVENGHVPVPVHEQQHAQQPE
jgi:hypothetical protein